LVRHAIETFIPIAPQIRQQLRAWVASEVISVPGSKRKRREWINPEAVRWVSPSGLPVANAYPKARWSAVRHYLHDKSKRCVATVGWKRVGKAQSSIAANSVHSFDSAHLALVAVACEREEIPLVTVHDSYCTLPCYASTAPNIA